MKLNYNPDYGLNQSNLINGNQFNYQLNQLNQLNHNSQLYYNQPTKMSSIQRSVHQHTSLPQTTTRSHLKQPTSINHSVFNHSNGQQSNGQQSNGQQSNDQQSNGHQFNGQQSNGQQSNCQQSNGQKSNSRLINGQQSINQPINGQHSNGQLNQSNEHNQLISNHSNSHLSSTTYAPNYSTKQLNNRNGNSTIKREIPRLPNTLISKLSSTSSQTSSLSSSTISTVSSSHSNQIVQRNSLQSPAFGKRS